MKTYFPLTKCSISRNPYLSVLGTDYHVVDLNKNDRLDTDSYGGRMVGSEPLVNLRELRAYAIQNGKSMLTSADLERPGGPGLFRYSKSGDS